MPFEVEIHGSVLVDVEEGGAQAASHLTRDHVCNDWLLRYREGCASDALHFTVKGMSAEVIEARPFVGNRLVQGAKPEEEL